PPPGVSRLVQAYPEFEADPYGFLPIDRDGQLLPRQGEPVVPTPRLPDPPAGRARFPRSQAVSGRLPLPMLRLARHPRSEGEAFPTAGPAVRLAFHTGSQKNPALHGQAREFARQLARQQDGLNAMTAEQYLQGRALYKNYGRGGSKEQERARKDYEENLTESNKDRGMSESEARRVARSSMETLAALHEQDGTAGGQNRIGRDPFGNPSLGTSGVNSSIGRQHQDNVQLLDQAAVHMLRTGQGQALLNVEVVLCDEPERTDRYRLDLHTHRERIPPVELPRDELHAQAQAAHTRQLWEREVPAVPGQARIDPDTGTPSVRIPDAYRNPITGTLGPTPAPRVDPRANPRGAPRRSSWSRPPLREAPDPATTASTPAPGSESSVAGSETPEAAATATPPATAPPSRPEPPGPDPAAGPTPEPSGPPDQAERPERSARPPRTARSKQSEPTQSDRERRQAEREARIRKALARDGMSPKEVEDTLAGLRAAELGLPEPPAESIRRAREQRRRQGQNPDGPTRSPWPRNPNHRPRPGPDRDFGR
ncbi:MAG: polymorphic toxin type 15 domain-containing protein, partial [Pseudoclavibacter sp.]|nr:polymorphic toxin type 15 domain-containing protein [Pseudoclavibacter sp.]